MFANQSKLVAQLKRERRSAQKNQPLDDKIQDIYSILTKIDSKNLLISQWLAFMIEKGFVKNSHKIFQMADIYDEIKASEESEPVIQNQGKQENQKFSKKKFILALEKLGRVVSPYMKNSYEQVIYPQIASNQHFDVRVKVDDIRKFLTREVIDSLRKYDRELEMIFEIYIPENFNDKLAFTWQQLRFLEKKLPIICLFRFLWESEICPHHISSSQFIEIMYKLIPPASTLNNQNPKQNMFYSNQSIIAYSKQAITSKKIKLLEGDIGLTFFDFSMAIIRLAIEITKQKTNVHIALQKLLQLLNLKQLFNSGGSTKGKANPFQEKIKQYFESGKKINKKNIHVEKRQTKKNIEEILEVNEIYDKENISEFYQNEITNEDFRIIKKGLEDDLPSIPEHPTFQKQNDANYKPEHKHIVIGEQIPKIPEKNKAASKKNDKNQQPSHRFPMQEVVQIDQSSDHYSEIIKKSKNVRTNNEYPVILTEIVYPRDFQNLYINPKAEIYLETTYIHLGEKNNEKAYLNFCKARSICENSKNLLTQFFFIILEAQIYEAAGRDGKALLSYNKARELALNPANKNQMLKSVAYKGLAACLYHLQEYEYAFRCFEKFREIKGSEIQVESTEKAILENNIGCCLMILNRNTQAYKHFDLSHSIFDLVQGRLNARTLVVQQNSNKNKKAYIERKPQYKTAWRIYQEKQPFSQSTAKPGNKKKK